MDSAPPPGFHLPRQSLENIGLINRPNLFSIPSVSSEVSKTELEEVPDDIPDELPDEVPDDMLDDPVEMPDKVPEKVFDEPVEVLLDTEEPDDPSEISV